MGDNSKTSKSSKSTIKSHKKLEERLIIGDSKPLKLPKMPAWKINALNQVGEDTLNQVLEKLDNQNRVMVIRPTGFGKSYMLAGLTSAKNIDGSDRFKKCLYIYPTKVIKSDMLDTYGITGGDSRANKLKNTTFITYHMLGELVRIAGLKYEQSDDIDDINESVADKSLKITKLGNENEVYDTSAITWYNNLIKNKNRNTKKEVEDLTDRIKELNNKLKIVSEELNKLIESKSKAKVKMGKLNNEINLLQIELENSKNKINKLKSSVHNIKVASDTETINITSADDLYNWLKSFDLILIDEAHRTGMSSFTALWDNMLKDLVCNGTTKMVGATATPYRLDGVDLEESIFGEGSKLKKIDINDCIKPNNYEYLGINLDIIMSDPDVLDEGTTREYLESRGLFKEIDYVYAIHNKEEFISNILKYMNKSRHYGNSITEENKDKLLKAVNNKELIDRREFCKLSGKEKSKLASEDANTVSEINEILGRDMSEAEKQYALNLLGRLKKAETKELLKRKIEYKLTTEELDEVFKQAHKLDKSGVLDYELKTIISRQENYLKPSEIQYITNKVNEIPDVSELIQGSISDRNTYGLRYMKFIVFFASSEALNEYIAIIRDLNNKTMIGKWFSEAFPGYTICEAALHTGRKTMGIPAIKPEELGDLKPTDKVIDIIYCVDQLNMGYHVENITGVILFRNTESASVYNQQIGRCCSVRAENNTIMIDIIDKKPIEDIMKSVSSEFEFGLGEDGKQKDLRYLLDDDCINVCDLSSSIIKTIDNMRDMNFTDAETVRFLYSERYASAEIIHHMTNIDMNVIIDVINKVEFEKDQLNKIKSSGVRK